MRMALHTIGVAMLVSLYAGVLSGCDATSPSEDFGKFTVTPSGHARFYVDANINDQPVRLILDTGSSNVALFRPSAERLKLKITDPRSDLLPPAGATKTGMTEACRVARVSGQLAVSR